ncbi:DNA-binding transcriptional regulator LysR [compost metagenome]
MAPGDGLRARVDAAFSQGDQRVMHFETPFGATICHMVGLGLGVSIVNPLVASTCLHTGIQMKPFKPDIPFVSYLLVPVHAPANALLQRFTTLLQEVIDDSVQALRI